MATNRDPDDFEALLAEVDRSLAGGGKAHQPVRQGTASRAEAERPRADSGGSAVARSVVPAAVVAAFVALLFVFLPFLGAVSGAAGAFLGALLAGLWARWRG